VIDVASGTVTQAQAGYPSITTADSVTKTGAGTGTTGCLRRITS